MVNIDNVYQKVLVLANKEQRGYVTPQEFNLFANQAQLEIFEQYFYDINQFGRAPGNENEYGDILNLLNEKISVFKFHNNRPVFNTVIAGSGALWNKPPNMYRLGTVWYSTTGDLINGAEIQEVNANELMDILSSPLTTPTLTNPIYVEDEAGLIIYPSTITQQSTVIASFVALPIVPRWGYVVISEKAMFDPSTTTHFDLHPTEETELVYKILKYAGISMDKDSIMRAGQGMEMSKISQEKQ
tara:strand:- start:1523 stop:2251 length:729 start_codon:yes stop_codon:yes gene_type:complete